MGNFKSTTEILNLVFSGETLNTVQSTAECFNAVYSTDDNALKVNVIGGGGGSGTDGTSGTSGTSGIDGLSGATGADGTSGTSGTSGVDGVADISEIADKSILYNDAGTLTGKTNLTFNDTTHTFTSLSDTFLTGGGDNFNFGYNNTVSHYGNAVFGANNICDSYSNFIAGNSNRATNYQNAIFGQSNIASERSIVGGRQNNSTGSHSLSVGYNMTNSGAYTLAVGRGHVIANSYDGAIGSYNTTTNNGFVNNILIGQGLQGGYNYNMTAVGYGNSGITGLAYEDGVMFQVGCGSGDTSGISVPVRRNGLTVKRNMDVEFGGDPIIYDKVDGTGYRIQVSGGTLQIVAV